MALEISAIIVLLFMWLIDHFYREVERRWWPVWDALRCGDASPLDKIDEHLTEGLQLLVETGRAAYATHVLGKHTRPHELLATLITTLDTWIGFMSQHLLQGAHVVGGDAGDGRGAADRGTSAAARPAAGVGTRRRLALRAPSPGRREGWPSAKG